MTLYRNRPKTPQAAAGHVLRRHDFSVFSSFYSSSASSTCGAEYPSLCDGVPVTILVSVAVVVAVAGMGWPVLLAKWAWAWAALGPAADSFFFFFLGLG